jgi:tetratricopeptide (TPR) repeat protein
MSQHSEDAKPDAWGAWPEEVLAPLAKRSQSDFEVDFFGSILRRAPDYVDVLRCQGELLSRKGRHVEALDIDRRLARLAPQDAVVLYNLACSLSRNEHCDEALVALRQALETGYDDFEYLELDGDFDLLRADPRFQTLVDEFCPKPKRRPKRTRRKS